MMRAETVPTILAEAPAAPSSEDLTVRCHHCGKLTVVSTAGKGNEFTHRCPHCKGYHKFTKAGHHGSGAVNYRVTKVEAAPGSSRDAGLQSVRSSTGGSQ
jgi:phage FluMu protein Com